MAKELIVIKIKIHILVGGYLVKRKEKVPIHMLQVEWNLLVHGMRIKLYKVNGYSQMVHLIVVNSKIINPMDKVHGQ